MANLGYVGLGVMGGRMADRLLGKGHTVTGTKSKAQWLLDKGMTWGDTPRAVAQAADVIFVMVTDSTALDKTKAAGFPIIFVTDPWGTCIELTEGLDKSSRTGLAKQPAE